VDELAKVILQPPHAMTESSHYFVASPNATSIYVRKWILYFFLRSSNERGVGGPGRKYHSFQTCISTDYGGQRGASAIGK
jgi:hypothetical protein